MIVVVVLLLVVVAALVLVLMLVRLLTGAHGCPLRTWLRACG